MQQTRINRPAQPGDRPRASRRTIGERRFIQPHRRQGSLSVLSVFAILACGICVALVISSARFSVLRSESQQCAEAAALAGCRSLLSDDLLRQNTQQFEVEARVAQCRSNALQVAQLYQSTSGIAPLRPDDIQVAQRISGAGKAPTLMQESAAPNWVQVQFSNSVGGSGTQSAGLLTVGPVQINAAAAALLQNRIRGFRVRSQNAVPLAPLAIPDDPRQLQSGCWTADIENYQGSDDYRWSDADQAVTREADRLPEITLLLTADTFRSAPGQLLPLNVANAAASSQHLRDQLQHGLTHEQLQAFPEATLQFPLTVQALPLSTTELQQLARQLQSLIGQIRMYPLCDVSAQTESAANDQDRATAAAADTLLTRPVAARLLKVDTTQPGRLQVVLQPCVFSTATAVVAEPGEQISANPYIWTIQLAGSR